MPAKFLLLFMILIPSILSQTNESTSIREIYCDDKGAIGFARKPKWLSVTIQEPTGNTMENVPGDWDGKLFVSDEGLMRLPGTYIIKDPKHDDQKVECPGFKFSCKLVNITINYCTLNNSILKANFTLTGENLDELQFSMTPRTGKKLTYGKNLISKQLMNLNINQSENNVILRLENSPSIGLLEISHPKCISRYVVSEKERCIDEALNIRRLTLNFSCDKNLNLTKRIECRLSKRDKDEYSNYYPQECKNQSDDCAQRYFDTSHCWSLSNSSQRISCIKNTLNYKNISLKKTECNKLLDAYSHRRCNKVIVDETLSLILFRLTNLEEEAERLMDSNRLSKIEVAQFIMEIEKIKLNFTMYKSYSKRKSLLLDARTNWKNLIGEIK